MANDYVPITDPSLERPSKFDFTADSALLRSFGEEFSNSFLQSLEYYPLNSTSSAPTNIYGEQDKDGLVYSTMIRVKSHFEWSPSKRKLESWGIKEERDLVVYTSIKILEAVNISPKVGDFYKIESFFYKIVEVQVDKREAASYLPLSIRYICKRSAVRERPGD